MYCFLLNNLELLVIPEPIKGQNASFESLYEKGSYYQDGVTLQYVYSVDGKDHSPGFGGYKQWRKRGVGHKFRVCVGE